MPAELSTALAHAGASAAVVIAGWAVIRAERMTARTNHVDRAALVAICAGAAGVAASLATGGLGVPLPLALAALAVGGGWWIGAGPLRRLLLRRVACRPCSRGARAALALVNRATGIRR